MNKYEIDSSYKQFYIADAGIEQDAPDDWTDEDIEKRYNSRKFITALVTSGEITSRIICFEPEKSSNIEIKPDFEIYTHIEIQTGKIGIYEWPWEKLEEHDVEPGQYEIKFCGFNQSVVDDEKDYYTVEIKKTI